MSPTPRRATTRRPQSAAADVEPMPVLPPPPQALPEDPACHLPPDPRLAGGPLVLRIPLPPSINAYYRAVVRPGQEHAQSMISREGRAYRLAVARTLRTILPPDWAPLTGPLRIRIDLFMAMRGSDPDNRAKACLDALQEPEGKLSALSVFENDRQICELHLVRWYDRAKPRAEVRIWSERDPRRLDAWTRPAGIREWAAGLLAAVPAQATALLRRLARR